MGQIPRFRLLGLDFASASAEVLAESGCRGGLVICPSAPSLVMLTDDPAYRTAMTEADLVIPDSGFMVMVGKVLGYELKRVSGLEYLKRILQETSVRSPGASFWIMPDAEASRRNREWLERSPRLHLHESDTYIAPKYSRGFIEDQQLVDILKERRPMHIIICLGGGVQERLGWYLRRELSWHPGIHCIGAAIAFLSGIQVRIPDWADAWCLGWLFRCLSQPSVFLPRYLGAFRLLPLLLKYRQDLPPLRRRFEG